MIQLHHHAEIGVAQHIRSAAGCGAGNGPFFHVGMLVNGSQFRFWERVDGSFGGDDIFDRRFSSSPTSSTETFFLPDLSLRLQIEW